MNNQNYVTKLLTVVTLEISEKCNNTIQKSCVTTERSWKLF